MKYSVDELFHLWDVYHRDVHTADTGIPCDDDCSVITFLKWLKMRDS